MFGLLGLRNLDEAIGIIMRTQNVGALLFAHHSKWKTSTGKQKLIAF